MKSDFLLAITQLSAEKNLPKETVISAVETALASAYKKDNFAVNQNIAVRINPSTGKVQVWAEKIVVEKPEDTRREMTLEEAQQLKADAQIGDTIVVEATPYNAGLIAAQTAKQVILQRLHEAEHSAILEEFTDKEGDIVTGLIQRIEPNQISIDMGRTEAILSANEQVPTERYRLGQRLKVYLMKVAQTSRGPKVMVSRSHPDLLRRLLELEVPEIYNGIVDLKSIAREAGYRSKIAVSARQEGIDPVGCCVGLRGIRIQNIVNELNNEKIDVVLWSPVPAVYIANALSPARVLGVVINENEGTVVAVVPDKQLSLAIGKEGQNVRLAAKLTGWRIDIKSASAAEAERAEAIEPETPPETEGISKEIQLAEEAIIEEEFPLELPVEEEPALVSSEVTTEPGEQLPPLDSEFVPPQTTFEVPAAPEEKSRVRFAEDILTSAPTKPVPKSKKKKSGTKAKDDTGELKQRKRRRQQEIPIDEEDEEY